MKYEWYMHKYQDFVSSGNMFTNPFRSGSHFPEVELTGNLSDFLSSIGPFVISLLGYFMHPIIKQKILANL